MIVEHCYFDVNFVPDTYIILLIIELTYKPTLRMVFSG